MRLFVAAIPPASVQREIALAVEEARGELVGRWVPAQNLHLTLAFLGELDPARLPELRAAVARAAEHPRFSMRFSGLGAFSSLQRARVAFLRATEGEEWLGRLAASLCQALPRELRPREERRFRAHLTLARFKQPPPREALAALAEQLAPWSWSFSVEALHLMESRLDSGGAVYRDQGYFPLRAGGA